MQPKYYLLRNNQESGPYTIDELLLQRLTSTDLVWVQGRTNAWCAPSELEEFTVTYTINQDKLNEMNTRLERGSSGRPNRSGRGEIESRAEEIRRKVLSQAILPGSRHLEIHEDVSPTGFRMPEDRINLVVHKKRMRKPNPQFLAICFMLVFIAGAWFSRDIWMNRSRFLDSVARPFQENATVVIPEKKQTAIPQTISVVTPADSVLSQVKIQADSLSIKPVSDNIVSDNKNTFVQKKPVSQMADSNTRITGPVTEAATAKQVNPDKDVEVKDDSNSLKTEAKIGRAHV